MNVFFRLVCAGVLIALIAQVAVAGYTDELWNESEDRVYYDCADWSGIHNTKNTNFGGNYYFYSKHRSNWRYMRTPTNWGYPADARLKGVGFSNVAWACVHIRGFDKELHFNGATYTDDPSAINYKTSDLSYRGWSTIYWSIYRTKYKITISSNADSATVRNSVTYYGKHTTATGRKKKKSKTVTPSDSREFIKWQMPDVAVNGTVHNFWTHVVVTLPTPENVSGVKITAVSNRSTAVYEKQEYCLQKNKTSEGFQYCDLVEWEYQEYTGTIPYGHDQYLLAYEPDWNITMTIYTPFEKKVVYPTFTHVEEPKPETPHIKNHNLLALMGFMVPIILTIKLYRRI